MSFSAFALPSGGVAAAPPRPGTLRRRPSRRCSRVRAGSDASDASPDDSGDFSLRALARRVEQIKRDEARGSTTMPVIVLDATLPGQRLGLRFDKKDTRRALNAGTALGPLAEVGDVFLAMVNLARHLGVDAESAVRRANHRFESRFRAMEQAAAEDDSDLQHETLDRLEDRWQAAKRQLAAE